MATNKWSSVKNGDTREYFLSKEHYPDWYAKVYKYNGQWVFGIGERVKAGIEQRTFYGLKGYKTIATAKKKAIASIVSESVKLDNEFTLYIKDTEGNRFAMAGLLGPPEFPLTMFDLDGSQSYIQIHLRYKRWRPSFHYEWLYVPQPEVLTLEQLKEKLTQ